MQLKGSKAEPFFYLYSATLVLVDIKDIKFCKIYLVVAFIYLYICPLYISSPFSYPQVPDREGTKILGLKSNRRIFNACFFQNGNHPFYYLTIFRNQTFNP